MTDLPLVVKENVKNADYNTGAVILINKPYDWSSFDVVKKIKFNLKIDKIGHAGTLDPLATGLLILCTGKMTKKISEFQDMPKIYHGEISLGKTTPSYDLETEADSECDIEHLTEEQILQASHQFKGAIMQIPPVYSAIKVDGKRAYKKARRGKAHQVEIQPREVFIYDFKITSIEKPKVKFEVRCSKGTYIRSLAHDFGKALHCGGHLTALERVAIGDFTTENAWEIDDFISENKK